MCCDRDTEEQLRHQARADFHDLIHHHSRSLQGLLATTADALRGKCNVTSTLELGQAIFLSTNRSRRVKKNLNRLESNKMRGGRRRRKEHTESRLLEIGNCYETTVVFLELAKANLEPCELFPSSHPPSHHSFLFHHLATTFSINHHAVAELLTSSLPSPLPLPSPSPSPFSHISKNSVRVLRARPLVPFHRRRETERDGERGRGEKKRRERKREKKKRKIRHKLQSAGGGPVIDGRQWKRRRIRETTC